MNPFFMIRRIALTAAQEQQFHAMLAKRIQHFLWAPLLLIQLFQAVSYTHLLDEALKLPTFAEAFHALNYVMAPSNMHPEGCLLYTSSR